MPNPTRLYQLTQLREQAHLTLTDMAQRCGLTGKQARKTVSDWEAGHATPRASRRTPFMRYLWHDLHLRQSSTRFAELWQILVEEWDWAPITDDEYVQLQAFPLEPPAPESPVPASSMVEDDSPAVIPSTPSEWLDLETPAAATASDNSLPSTPAIGDRLAWPFHPVERQQLLIALPIFLLMVAGFLWWGNGLWHPSSATLQEAALPDATYLPQPVSTMLATLSPVSVMNTSSTQPIGNQTQTDALALVNRSFDYRDGFDGWNVHKECDYQVITDGAVAHDGDRYLAIRNRRPNCYSFYQDLFTPLSVGATYRIAIWLRSPVGNTRRGRLALWALGPNREQRETNFAVNNPAWTCLETTLTVHKPNHDQLKAEVYLDSRDGLDYSFDNAMLGQGSESLCPPPQLAITELQLVQPSGRIYPGASVGVQALVKNQSASAAPYTLLVRYWVAEAADGEAMDPSANRQVMIPPLAAGESATAMIIDALLPINLPTDQRYFIVADLSIADAPANFSQALGRTSRAFAVLPCEQGTLFCDVPADHWAAPEIQAWFDAGITQGCRSQTEPFLNRPFCPDGIVQRWMMAVLLLRWLEGKDYQPPGAYQGLFEDVPIDFDGIDPHWIEVLTTKWVDMESEACPRRGQYRRFCPRDPLRRIDFLRALWELHRWELITWELTSIEGTLFADMKPGSTEARVAEYMAQQGYLPTDDTDCPETAGYRRFCPNAPLRRASAAVMMSRALGLITPGQ